MDFKRVLTIDTEDHDCTAHDFDALGVVIPKMAGLIQLVRACHRSSPDRHLRELRLIVLGDIRLY